jgi:hypothetical protein
MGGTAVMMAVIIALLAVGFFIGAVGIAKGVVWLGVVGFGLFLVALIYGLVQAARLGAR